MVYSLIAQQKINTNQTSNEIVNTLYTGKTYNKKAETDFNGNISNWDVSNVKDMSFMFYECTNFNSDISAWDVSNVT